MSATLLATPESQAPSWNGSQSQSALAAQIHPGPYIRFDTPFTGLQVMTPSGAELGEIEAIMLDLSCGRVAYAVLALGDDFLGKSHKLFPIPWSALTLEADEEHFTLDIDPDELEQAPCFDKDYWPAMTDLRWAGHVHGYYHVAPYWELH